MKTLRATSFNRFISLFSKSTIQRLEQTEIAILEDVGKLVHRNIDNSSLKVDPSIENDIKYLISLGRKAKTIIAEKETLNSLKQLPVETLEQIERIFDDNQKLNAGDIVLSKSIDKNSSDQSNLQLRSKSLNNLSLPSVVKSTFLRFYFARLRKALSEEDIYAQRIPLDKISRLIDSTMLGSPSERIYEHFTLCGSTMNQQQLQSCLYSLYEPEIQTCVAVISAIDGLNKKQLKPAIRFANTFLLDHLELNTKARCLLAWSDPNYSGFNSLPADLCMPVETLIRSRRTFFPEGQQLSETFFKALISQRKLYYEERREMADLWRWGFVFFIATCLADYAVCTI